jgi:acetylornithine/N-succinyldiaminopimelate aminotransferase
MSNSEIIGLFDRFVVGNYGRYPIALVRGEGCYVWDADGRRYLDLLAGIAVNALGHCHPRVVAALREQASTLMHVSNFYYIEGQGRLAQALGSEFGGGKCFFCNSGTEAVETMIKLARLYGGEGRRKIVCMENSFHGRTMGALSATGQKKYQKGLDPMLPGFEHARFNDIDDVKRKVDDATCAVLVELVQGEGGIRVAEQDFIRGLRELCDRRGMLLLIDEVQTGIGRIGAMFGHQVFGVKPDAIALAKGLGGGMPIGAMIAAENVAGKLAPGTHASTFGGNPLACSAALAVIQTIRDEHLLEHVQRVGEYTRKRLRELAAEFDFITEVRGLGMMNAAQLSVPGKDIARQCLDNGLLINCTCDTVLRFVPPLTITPQQVDEGMAILRGVLARQVSTKV